MFDMEKYPEFVQKLASEIIDDAIGDMEKEASDESEQNPEEMVKQAYEAYQESQIVKQAAQEAFDEAQLNEDAAMAVLENLGIDLDDYELVDENDEEE